LSHFFSPLTDFFFAYFTIPGWIAPKKRKRKLIRMISICLLLDTDISLLGLLWHNCILFIFDGTGVWTQSFMFAKQATAWATPQL
jgi:biotin transporter BioY